MVSKVLYECERKLYNVSACRIHGSGNFHVEFYNFFFDSQIEREKFDFKNRKLIESNDEIFRPVDLADQTVSDSQALLMN